MQPRDPIDVGPELEWHASYDKLYRAFWYTLRASKHHDQGEGGVRFQFASMSRAFVPPNSHLTFPKIIYPMGLLLLAPLDNRSAPAVATSATTSGAAGGGATAPVSPCSLVLLTYGELDVFSHAWATPARLVRDALLTPAALRDAVRASSFLPSAAERVQQRAAAAAGRRSGAVENELSAFWYRSALSPLLTDPRSDNIAAFITTNASGGSCRAAGFQTLWNSALYPFEGAPLDYERPGLNCGRLKERTADSAQDCCALCAEQGAERCPAWSFFAPTCYWSSRCKRTIVNHQQMWGAVSGYRSSRVSVRDS